MDSRSNCSFQTQNNQHSSGLLRFLSAPISSFANFNDNGVTNDPVLSFQEFEDKSAMRMNCTQSCSGLPPHYPRQHSAATSSSAMDSSYGLIGSNLTRQNSSPAGHFGNHSIQNGYLNGTNGEARIRAPSSLGMLSQISEIGSKSIDANSPGFSSYGSWNDSHFADNGKLFSNSQNGGLGNRMNLLSHHLSLPKTSIDMVTMEKFLRFQDSVPCKTRAKRGCATHPRSIAERVRRTRISERMRKLQELVPNMDKQTNTADMLDLAVDYIKNLQKQYKILSEKRANCKCSQNQI